MLLTLSKFDYLHKAQVSMNNNTFSEISNSKRNKLSPTRAKKPFKIITGLRSKQSKNASL